MAEQIASVSGLRWPMTWMGSGAAADIVVGGTSVAIYVTSVTNLNHNDLENLIVDLVNDAVVADTNSPGLAALSFFAPAGRGFFSNCSRDFPILSATTLSSLPSCFCT